MPTPLMDMASVGYSQPPPDDPAVVAGSWRGGDPGISRGDLGLVFSCGVCGRPIVLNAEQHGIVLPDREEFLTSHASCLAARRGAEAV